MGHLGEASLHINMAKLTAKNASDQADRNPEIAAAEAQAATAYALAGVAEAILHLADQIARRDT